MELGSVGADRDTVVSRGRVPDTGTANADKGVNSGTVLVDGGAPINTDADHGVVDIVKVREVGHVGLISVLDSTNVSSNIHGVKNKAVVAGAAGEGAKASHGHPVGNDEEQAKYVGAPALEVVVRAGKAFEGLERW